MYELSRRYRGGGSARGSNRQVVVMSGGLVCTICSTRVISVSADAARSSGSAMWTLHRLQYLIIEYSYRRIQLYFIAYIQVTAVELSVQLLASKRYS